MKSLTPLRNRPFRRMWLAGLLSLLGSQISRIGLLLHVSRTGDEVASLAVLVALETLPGALAAPLAGAVVDRFNKRSVMIASDLVRLLLMLAVLAHPTVGVIYLMAALHSVVTAFFEPAKLASIPLVVGPKELLRANGLDKSASNLTLILGPVVGAELLLGLGLSATLIIDALTFLLSAALLAGVDIRQDRKPSAWPSPRAALAELGGGWGYLARHRLARHLNLLLFTSLVCVGIWTPLAPGFIRDQLGGSEAVLGWQFGAFGLGAALGGLWAPRLAERLGAGPALFLGFLAEGLLMSVYGLVPQLAASMLIIFVWGNVVSVALVPFYSILQEIVDEECQGRVFAVVKQSENVAVALAMPAAVLLNSFLNSRVIFLSAGLFYFGVVALSALSAGGRALLAPARAGGAQTPPTSGARLNDVGASC